MSQAPDKDDRIARIREKALWMRRTAFRMVHDKQLGHPGGDFSAADIVATLYFGVLRYDPSRPAWVDRDRFVMSKGHATGVLYTALAAAGYFPEDWLETYMHNHSMLNGHPNRNYLPGIETNTGPLGHGFRSRWALPLPARSPAPPIAPTCSPATASSREGSNWEAAMTAGNRKVANLTLIIDRNRLQQGGGTEETNGLDPLDAKYRAFGWDVTEIDGHDHSALLDVLGAPVGDRKKPLCIIANTIKGKGVSFMENQANWHHGVPNDAQFAQAMKELV